MQECFTVFLVQLLDGVTSQFVLLKNALKNKI